MIVVLFVRSDKLVSRLIRAITGEDCSHCAIVVPEEKIVWHSTLAEGVHSQPMRDFMAEYEIVHAVAINKGLRPDSTLLYQRYDWPAFLYLGLRLLMKKIWIKLPKANLLKISGMVVCTEFVSEEVLGTPNAELTPYQLCEKLESLKLANKI